MERSNSRPPRASEVPERPRVLLVDDEAPIRRALCRLLHGRYEVVVAPDGATAMDLVMRERFDVVLTDVGLPGLNGLELLRVIRSYDLDAQVVLMTGSPTLDTEVAAIELGALVCLEKPCEQRVLFAALDRATKMATLARAKREASMIVKGTRAIDDRALAAAFERALDSLTPVFQPIVARRSKNTIGYESLLRTHEPSLPNPGAVVDAAERLGRLQDLGRAVRNAAARAFAPRASDTLLFLNLHPADLRDPDLYDPHAPLSQMAPRVVLEITERAALEDVAEVQKCAATLRARGFQLAVDDLGAGYAGLSTIAALEPEIVKLDMSLVRDIETSPVRAHLVRCMTDLCRDLDMRVVAEGIETNAELARILEIGCDYLQGYLFGRPRADALPSAYVW